MSNTTYTANEYRFVVTDCITKSRLCVECENLDWSFMEFEFREKHSETILIGERVVNDPNNRINNIDNIADEMKADLKNLVKGLVKAAYAERCRYSLYDMVRVGALNMYS